MLQLRRGYVSAIVRHAKLHRLRRGDVREPEGFNKLHGLRVRQSLTPGVPKLRRGLHAGVVPPHGGHRLLAVPRGGLRPGERRHGVRHLRLGVLLVGRRPRLLELRQGPIPALVGLLDLLGVRGRHLFGRRRCRRVRRLRRGPIRRGVGRRRLQQLPRGDLRGDDGVERVPRLRRGEVLQGERGLGVRGLPLRPLLDDDRQRHVYCLSRRHVPVRHLPVHLFRMRCRLVLSVSRGGFLHLLSDWDIPG